MSIENSNSIQELIANNNTNELTILISSNPSLLIKRDDDGRLPLHYAVTNNNLDVTRFLIDNYVRHEYISLYDDGSDSDSFIDDSGYTPLHIASSISNISLFELLLPYFNPSLKTSTGLTPLLLAVSKSNKEVVKKLLSLDVNILATDKFKRSPFHRASANGDIALVRLLAQHVLKDNAQDSEKFQKFINFQDKNGWSPLHYAKSERNEDIAKYLIELGVDEELEDNDGLLAKQV